MSCREIHNNRPAAVIRGSNNYVESVTVMLEHYCQVEVALLSIILYTIKARRNLLDIFKKHRITPVVIVKGCKKFVKSVTVILEHYCQVVVA